jgi:DNA-binding XRE family transcriptional regulator
VTFLVLTRFWWRDILCLVKIEIDEARLYEMIGVRIKNLRGQRRQEELATAIGLRRTSVANIERGRQKAPLYVLFKICAFLGVELDAILPKLDEVVGSHLVSVEVDQGLKQVTPKTAVALEALEKLLAGEEKEGKDAKIRSPS